MNTSTTDTPRTDKAIEAMGLQAYVVPVEVCRQIELELAVSLENQLKSQAEVAKLNHLLLKTESDLLQSQDINSYLDIELRIACKLADKAEADVAMFHELLNRAIQIADKIWADCSNGAEHTELAELKAKIK